MGACAYQCEKGYTDCNHDLGTPSSDGCEAELGSDPNHCGRCSNLCGGSLPSASPACSGGRCGFACNAGFLDCNGDLTQSSSDGCEVDGRSDAMNCRECSHACTSSCVNGMCVGEQPICEPFATTLRGIAGDMAIATNGTEFLVVFIDENGVSIASLSAQGKVQAGPINIDQIPLYGRVAAAFDGMSYVVSWAGASSVFARRYTPGTLNPVGGAASLDSSGGADRVFVTGSASGVMLAWQQANTFKTAPWTASRPSPDAARIFIPPVPLPMWGRFAIARDGAGFVVAFASADAGSDAGRNNQGVAVVTLDGMGQPAGAPQIVVHGRTDADYIDLATIGANAVLFETEENTSFNVGAVDGVSPSSLTKIPLPSMRSFAGGTNNGWVASAAAGSPHILSAVPIGPDGHQAGHPLMLVTLPSLSSPVMAAATMGTLFIWSRDLMPNKIEEVLLDPAGNVHNPCAP
jgi:hypothetical protein